MPNFDPGRVRVQLTCENARVSIVQISSERPDVAMVLRGRTADQALQSVPLLFALCGQAQARAARLAYAAARGEEYLPEIDPNVQREVLREHAWRCLLDLPPLLGEPALQQEFISALKYLADGNRDELRALLTRPDIAKLRLLLTQTDALPFPASRLLPILDAKNSLTEWPRLSAEFSRLPTWHEQAAETGAIARQAQKNANLTSHLSARWQARFDELMEWATGNEQIGAGGTVSATPVESGIGRAVLETARGLLMHEITLDGERIADYQIVAPTEWNFHPGGALSDHLLGQDAGNRAELQQHVARAVAALDPCVPWELQWA